MADTCDTHSICWRILWITAAIHFTACSADRGENGQDGAPGLMCWDLNGNGTADATEDVNGDGQWTALDCSRNSVFDVQLFGASGDGLADDTAPIQSAIEAAQTNGGGTVFFPPGTYSTTTELTVTSSNLHFLGDNAVILSGVARRVGTFLVQGTTQASVPILQPISKGDSSLWISTSDAESFQIGDVLRISTQEQYFEVTGRDYKKGEIVKIYGLDRSTGEIRISSLDEDKPMGGVALAYAHEGMDLQVKKLEMIRNITFEGLEIAGTGDPDQDATGIMANYVEKLRIHNCVLRSFETGLKILGSLSAVVSNNHMADVDQGVGYAIHVAGASRNILITNNTFENNRHSFTTTGGDGVCMDLTISANTAREHWRASPFHTHGNARFVIFSNNIVTNAKSGISTGSPHTLIIGNYIENTYQIGIYAGEAGGINISVVDNVIENCCTDYFAGININTSATVHEPNNFVQVTGNVVNNAPNSGGILINGDNPETVLVSDNIVQHVGFDGIHIFDGQRVLVTGNQVLDCRRAVADDRDGIEIKTSDVPDSAAIISNNIIDHFHTGIVVLDGLDRSSL